MEPREIRFVRRGELVSVGNVPPARTLLELLREDLGCTGTKEGCGEGDCGACTVVVAEPDGDALRWRAINSCIALAHGIDGKALWTVEDLASDDGTPHPAQEAMVRCHGSQCGFCTPGFVMSLFGMYRNHVARGEAVTRELATEALSGNLCRCTGYRPILDAAQAMGALPVAAVDEARIAALLSRPAFAGMTVSELLAARAADPEAQVVAGCTDVGLWITKQHRQFDRILDVTRCDELRRVDVTDTHLTIGAAATLTDAFAALVADRPQLRAFAGRFAGLPVRNAGTLGGNIANGSPIGDSMPLLIALDAHIVLASVRGERTMALTDFYTGYRRNVLAPDELLVRIEVPRARPGEFLRAYKISKRFDDDISAVCLVIDMTVTDGKVAHVSIGAGGVAATPVRAAKTEAALLGRDWTEAIAKDAAEVLRTEFQPIDDMRASAAYRTQVLGNLMRRYWLESQGMTDINLESFQLDEAPE
ncbi:xanthine dehydrogenase small subunit [Ramlibacter sp.]|uniref:xanthine dehydrogenase small subunit n=1 Tax=Ramlibacter sp. TaxID=1917967 RepID=UPI003D0E4368